MRTSLRTIVGATVMAAASIVPLAATAQATPDSGAGAGTDAVAASGWHRRGPFSTYAACDRVRSQMVSLGYPTQPCSYLRCGAGCTTPGVVSGWYYLIWN